MTLTHASANKVKADLVELPTAICALMEKQVSENYDEKLTFFSVFFLYPATQ